MRPCYQGELACDRFVPITVPLSTIYRIPGVLSAGSRRPLPKHQLEKIGVEPISTDKPAADTSVERKKDSLLKVRP